MNAKHVIQTSGQLGAVSVTRLRAQQSALAPPEIDAAVVVPAQQGQVWLKVFGDQAVLAQAANVEEGTGVGHQQQIVFDDV